MCSGGKAQTPAFYHRPGDPHPQQLLRPSACVTHVSELTHLQQSLCAAQERDCVYFPPSSQQLQYCHSGYTTGPHDRQQEVATSILCLSIHVITDIQHSSVSSVEQDMVCIFTLRNTLF